MKFNSVRLGGWKMKNWRHFRSQSSVNVAKNNFKPFEKRIFSAVASLVCCYCHLTRLLDVRSGAGGESSFGGKTRLKPLQSRELRKMNISDFQIQINCESYNTSLKSEDRFIVHGFFKTLRTADGTAAPVRFFRTVDTFLEPLTPVWMFELFEIDWNSKFEVKNPLGKSLFDCLSLSGFSAMH